MTRNTFCFSFLNRRKNARFTLHKNLILAFILRTITLFIHYYGNMGDKSYNKVMFSWNTVDQFGIVSNCVVELIWERILNQVPVQRS